MDTVYQIVWLALLIIFAVAEAATVGLTSVWFAIGSLGALVCALAGGNIWLQLGIFIVLSLVCLVALRPLAKKISEHPGGAHQRRPGHWARGPGHPGY